MSCRPSTLYLIVVVFSIVGACTPLASAGAQPLTSSSIFLVKALDNGELEARTGCDPEPPGRQSFDIAIIRFSEDGELEDIGQRVAAQQCIELAKSRNPNGVIVVVFVHGWRHNAAWDLPTGERDEHLREFQKILLRLSLRESERAHISADGRRLWFASGRRVVGVYLGWPGLTNFRLPLVGQIPDSDLLTFYNRYDKAREIAGSRPFQETLSGLVRTGHGMPGGEGTVILAAHSMGAMMLDVALTELLDKMVGGSLSVSRGCIELTGVQQPEIMPDSVILLNSAASVSISDELLKAIRGRVRKRVACGAPSPAAQPFPPFDAPLFVSLTSETDNYTRRVFAAVKLERTEGHEDQLITHDLSLISDTTAGGGHLCPPLGTVDRGQSWHCLRRPFIDSSGTLAQVSVDLPRQADPRDHCHDRYVLTRRPLPPLREGEPFWIVRVPGAVIDGHGDIFNERAGLLTMAFIQLSGSIMSLAQNYDDTFELESGPCRPR